MVIGPPLVLLTTWLGGGSAAVGLVSSIMPFLTVLQVPSTRFIARWGYRRVMLAGWRGRTLVLLGIAVLPFFKGHWTSARLVGVLAFILFGWSFLRGMANAAWLPWIRALIPHNQRGRFFAGQHIYIQLMGLTVLFLAGVILGRNPTAVRFSVLYLISFSAATMSLRYLARVPSPDIPSGQKGHGSLKKALKGSLGHRNFRRYLYYSFCWTVANGAIGAFTVLFLKREAGFCYREILWLGAIASAGMIVALALAGHLLDRWGSLPIMKICLTGIALYLGVWFLFAQKMVMPHFFLLVVLYIFYGATSGTYWISAGRLTLMAVPGDFSIVALAVYTTGVGILGGTTPLLWGVILDRIPAGVITPFGYFFLAGLFMNVVALIVLQWVKEARAERTIYVAVNMLTLPLRSIQQLLAYVAPQGEDKGAKNVSQNVSPDAADTRARNRDNCSGLR